jgi:hypothetical protein
MCEAWGDAMWSISGLEDPGQALCLLGWRPVIAGQAGPEETDGPIDEGTAVFDWDAEASCDEGVHAHRDVALAWVEPAAGVEGGVFGNEGSAVAQSVIGFEEDGMISNVWTD